MPTLLKDIHINDVSSVTRGAGIGVKVLLMKHAVDNKQEANMPEISIETIRKAHSEGKIDVHEMLDSVVHKLQRKDESPQQTLARSIDWRNPRFDKTVADLFALSVEVGKASPGPAA